MIEVFNLHIIGKINIHAGFQLKFYLCSSPQQHVSLVSLSILSFLIRNS